MTKHDEIIYWGWAKTRTSNYLPNMWSKYKITNVHINKMWAEQDGKCPCGRELAHPLRMEVRMGYEPEVDHLHRRDAAGNKLPCVAADVRGLLCGRCNLLLGKIRDNIDVLQGLLNYMRKNGEIS